MVIYLSGIWLAGAYVRWSCLKMAAYGSQIWRPAFSRPAGNLCMQFDRRVHVRNFDIEDLFYDQLTAVKLGHPLTSITWPYCGLRLELVEILCFFEVNRWSCIGWVWSQAHELSGHFISAYMTRLYYEGYISHVARDERLGKTASHFKSAFREPGRSHRYCRAEHNNQGNAWTPRQGFLKWMAMEYFQAIAKKRSIQLKKSLAKSQHKKPRSFIASHRELPAWRKNSVGKKQGQRCTNEDDKPQFFIAREGRWVAFIS